MMQQQKRPKYLIFARFGHDAEDDWYIFGQTDDQQEAAELYQKAQAEKFREVLLLTGEYLPDNNDYEIPGEYDICW